MPAPLPSGLLTAMFDPSGSPVTRFVARLARRLDADLAHGATRNAHAGMVAEIQHRLDGQRTLSELQVLEARPNRPALSAAG